MTKIPEPEFSPAIRVGFDEKRRPSAWKKKMDKRKKGGAKDDNHSKR